MGRLTAANSMYDLANYKGTSSLAACISSVSTNFSGLTVLAHCAGSLCCNYLVIYYSVYIFLKINDYIQKLQHWCHS